LIATDITISYFIEKLPKVANNLGRMPNNKKLAFMACMPLKKIIFFWSWPLKGKKPTKITINKIQYCPSGLSGLSK
jgi:hypothetical protein